MQKTKEQQTYSTEFVSEGAAWQWAVDTANLLPEQVLKYAAGVGLSSLGTIEIYKRQIEQGKTVKEIEQDLEALTAQASSNRQEDYKQITAGNNLQLFLDSIADSVNTPKYSTGFPSMDTALDGGLYTGLYIIGAIPSLGKTTLVMQIADQLAAQGKDVLIISLEMGRTELMAKSISRTTAELVTGNRQKYGDTKNAKTARDILDGARWKNFNQKEHLLLNDSVTHYGEYADHLYIVEGKGDISVREIRAAVEKHRAITGNTPVLVVDYIQIISAYDVRATDKANMDTAVKELRNIARDNNTPVIGISAFNRGSYKDKANMSAFKESGGIEYNADVLLSMLSAGTGNDDIKAKQKEPREIELTILKNRLAPVGVTLLFGYYAKFNWFIDNGIKKEDEA